MPVMVLQAALSFSASRRASPIRHAGAFGGVVAHMICSDELSLIEKGHDARVEASQCA
jgi:hypothetical protein